MCNVQLNTPVIYRQFLSKGVNKPIHISSTACATKWGNDTLRWNCCLLLSSSICSLANIIADVMWAYLTYRKGNPDRLPACFHLTSQIYKSKRETKSENGKYEIGGVWHFCFCGAAAKRSRSFFTCVLRTRRREISTSEDWKLTASPSAICIISYTLSL